MYSLYDFCGSDFWDTNLTWGSDWPDFTPCFQQTALIWFPCGWLWFIIPFYLTSLLRSPSAPIPVNNFNSAKTIIWLMISFTTFFEVLKSASEFSTGHAPALVFTISPIIQSLTSAFCIALVQIERSRGYVTSGVLFVFLLLLTLSGVIPFYSKVIHAVHEGTVDDLYRFCTFYIYYGLVLVQLVLSCIADSAPLTPEFIAQNHCPEISASILSRISFHWISSLVARGYRKTLTEVDLFVLKPLHTSRVVAPILHNAWQKEWRHTKQRSQSGLQSLQTFPRYLEKSSDRAPLLSNGASDSVPDVRVSPSGRSVSAADVRVSRGGRSKPSLFRVLVKCFGWDWMKAQACKLIADICIFINPLLLQQLIRFSTDESTQLWKGYVYAVAFFLVAVTQSVFMHQLFHISMTMGMRVKSALISAVYKKSLTMCKGAMKDSTVGEIVNLMSVDAQRIQDVSTYLWMVWSSPLQIIVAIIFLYSVIGWSVLAGVAVLVIMLPINALVASRVEKLEATQLELKDGRIKLLTEILSGMKLLKFFAWEPSFKQKVTDIRGLELNAMFKINLINGFIMFFWTCAPFAVTVAVFATYVLSSSDHVLTSEKAFVSISLLNIMRFPMTVLPMMIVYLVTAKVSLGRLCKFLSHDDLDPNNSVQVPTSEYAVRIENGSFSWAEEGAPILHDINMDIKAGSLVAVVGQVGTGKSSLLSAILGEMEKLNGHVSLTGSTGLVAQQAWIQNATLRDNVLFGLAYHKQRYDDVIRACALEPDLEMLPGKDMTEIGERGINLSGGQKQRVALARAVYNDVDIYLLDDPLSAVDSHVGKHIFENIISDEGLLRNKTRVLVTHGVHWLPHVDQILVLVDGQITEVGTYRQLLERKGAFATFLRTYFVQHRDHHDEVADDDNEILQVKEELLREYDSSPEPSELINKPRENGEAVAAVAKKDAVKCERSESKDNRLIEDEEVETGTVKMTVYWQYIRALKAPLALAYMLFLIASYGITILSSIWITMWTDDPIFNDSHIQANNTRYISARNYYLETYAGIGLAEGFLVLSYSVLFAIAAIRASRVLHRKMLNRIMRAPLSFFDTTPIGRIVNRFSRDMETVDTTLPELLQTSVMDPFMIVLSTIVVISYSTPLFLAAVAVLAVLYLIVQRIYIPTSRQLNRLESKTRSPIYNHFNETLTGTSTIRAFNQQDRFMQTLESRVDQNLVFHYAMISCNRWLGLRLELLGNTAVLGAGLLAVMGRGVLTGGLVGLSLTYALDITENLNWMVRGVCELETNIVAVERLNEYSEVPVEAEWTIKETRPPDEWPQQGHLAIDNYSVRYRSGLDLVIRDLNVQINGGEKIGIVGRTGAGKSSLTLSLFRIIEGAGGRITIDGVDISTLGLHQLRSKLTILPQEPVLFSGSVRMNLDPFGRSTDAEIWRALDHAHLKQFLSERRDGLEYDCGEGGQNMSVGQRQLVCLARTLLRKTKILIFDEATAAIDLETDHVIQQTIRSEFNHCTILTIAHRLNTIMDSDRIIVLQHGRVSEFDEPKVLLEDKNSVFYSMAKAAGLV